MRTFLILLLSISAGFGELLTFDTTPFGSKESPLILRTFVPDPGLDPGVFANHGKAARSPKYNPAEGDDAEGEYEMMKVIPAAIAVNHGPSLSYVWDTTECRLLYAWQGGFLDLFPYWGDEGKGGRRAFDYSARLVGSLFYLAKPAARPKPKFLGYTLSKEGVPTFQFKLGEAEYGQTIEPVNRGYSFKIATSRGGRSDSTTYTGKLISRHQGFDRDLKIKKATTKAGQEVFKAYGCVACHSVDGSKGHGPSLAGLFGSKRPILEGDPVLADEAYLKESLSKPGAKTAEGFPPGYMPPYKFNEMEGASLILYLKSLSK
ncbi:MAG: hypothetical protein ACJAQT_000588 [Akkermansiaceae bacterium]|jgi:hypothetical protein